MKRKLIITAIGSRKIPTDCIPKLRTVCDYLKTIDCELRSGHANGTDMFFENNLHDKMTVFLPWNNFNGAVRASKSFVWSDFSNEQKDQAQLSFMEFHPRYCHIKNNITIRNFMCRNYFQIFGENNIKSDIVICCAKEDRSGVIGGTGQAVRIADYYNIPVLNVYKLDTDSIITKIKEMGNHEKMCDVQKESKSLP